jgi:hypothetical protein
MATKSNRRLRWSLVIERMSFAINRKLLTELSQFDVNLYFCENLREMKVLVFPRRCQNRWVLTGLIKPDSSLKTELPLIRSVF